MCKVQLNKDLAKVYIYDVTHGATVKGHGVDFGGGGVV